MSGDGEQEVSKQETKQYFRQADQNGDRSLDFNEVFEFAFGEDLNILYRVASVLETMDENENSQIDKLEFYLFFGGDEKTLERMRYDLREIEFPVADKDLGPFVMKYIDFDEQEEEEEDDEEWDLDDDAPAG